MENLNYTIYGTNPFVNERNSHQYSSFTEQADLSQIEILLGLENEDSYPQIESKKRRIAKKACDSCRAKHVKCDGEYPCDRCQTSMTDCKYEHVSIRRAPHSKSKELKALVKDLSTQMDQLKNRNAQLEELLSFCDNTTTISPILSFDQISDNQSVTTSSASSSPPLDANTNLSEIQNLSSPVTSSIATCSLNSLSTTTTHLPSASHTIHPSIFSSLDFYLGRYQDIVLPLTGINVISFDLEGYLNGTLSPKYAALTSVMLCYGAKCCNRTDHCKEFISKAKRLMQNLYSSIDPVVAITHGALSRPLLGSNQTEEAIVHSSLAISKGKELLKRENTDHTMAYTAICYGYMTRLMMSKKDVDQAMLKVGKYVDHLPANQQMITKCILNYIKAFSYIGASDVAIPLSLLDTAVIYVPKDNGYFNSTIMAIINGLRGAVYAWSGSTDMALAYCDKAMEFVPAEMIFMSFAILSICAQVYIKVNHQEGLEKCIERLQSYASIYSKATDVIQYILDPSSRAHHESTQNHWFGLGFVTLGEPLTK